MSKNSTQSDSRWPEGHGSGEGHDDTASRSPATVLVQVCRILDERWPAEETIRAIRRVLEAPADRRPVERTSRGWPVLRASIVGVRDGMCRPATLDCDGVHSATGEPCALVDHHKGFHRSVGGSEWVDDE